MASATIAACSPNGWADDPDGVRLDAQPTIKTHSSASQQNRQPEFIDG